MTSFFARFCRIAAATGVTVMLVAPSIGGQALATGILASDSLRAVSCAAPTSCMAVGYTHVTVDVAMAMTGNGNSWHVTPSPAPPGSLVSDLWAVSCRTTKLCIAVGSYKSNKGMYLPLAERWDGKAWHLLKPANPKTSVSSSLLGVSCPSSSVCIAVGNYTAGQSIYSLTERWNGSKWSTISSPSPAPQTQLAGVSCPSSTWCMATGSVWTSTSYYKPFDIEWNGSKWTQVSSPGRSPSYIADFHAISCNDASDCVEVGTWEPQAGGELNIINRWHGHGWFESSAVNVGKDEGTLSSVACIKPTSCWSVGYESHASKGNNITTTEGEYFNGSRWSMASTPNAPKSNQSSLYSISCPSATMCMAVGLWANKEPFAERTLTEAWKGTKWSRVNSPNP